MADDERKERRDSASSHSSHPSIENDDDRKSTSSESDHESAKHSTSSEHENDDHSSTDHEQDATDKHSTSSEHDDDDHVSEKSAASSIEEEPEKPTDGSSNSRRSSHSSAKSSDDHSHTTDDNHPDSPTENPPEPVYQNVSPDGLAQDDPRDGSIDSFGMNHVYANAAFTMEPKPDYQDTSGAESPSIRRQSVSTVTDYEHPNPPPSDLGFYTIPLQGTESERPPSSSTVVDMPDEESGWPWLTYLYGAAVFSIIFIIILIIYFSVSFA